MEPEFVSTVVYFFIFTLLAAPISELKYLLHPKHLAWLDHNCTILLKLNLTTRVRHFDLGILSNCMQ